MLLGDSVERVPILWACRPRRKGKMGPFRAHGSQRYMTEGVNHSFVASNDHCPQLWSEII